MLLWKLPLLNVGSWLAMRTRTYSYWLKAFDRSLNFRLEVHSEPHILFNDLLNRNKRKKNCITISIEQVIKLAKQRIGKPRIKTSTFIHIIMNEVGESGQKIFDRIFKLALEGYVQLQHEGKVPTLISHRIPKKISPIKRAPRPRPQGNQQK